MYIVHGLTRSYFTRKVTGYLDYTDRPWRLEPCPPGDHLGAQAAGWTGGIPVVTEPDGAFMWDSTTIIEHLDLRTDADRHVLPDDPTMRFLAHLLDDFSDEWFYRPAVGSRWNYEGNTEAAGWQITEELSTVVGFPGGLMRPNVVATMRANCAKLGVLDGTIDAIATDHAPHTRQAKERPFLSAPAGMLGLETAFAIANTELGAAGADIEQIVRLLSINPARIAGIDDRHGGSIEAGRPASELSPT